MRLARSVGAARAVHVEGRALAVGAGHLPVEGLGRSGDGGRRDGTGGPRQSQLVNSRRRMNASVGSLLGTMGASAVPCRVICVSPVATPIDRCRSPNLSADAQISVSDPVFNHHWRMPSRCCCLAQHDPRRRVVAGAFLAAQLAVDAGLHQARRDRGTQQQVVEPQAGIARPAVVACSPRSVNIGLSGCSSRIASHQPCATSCLNAARLFGWISASLSHDLVG